MEQASQTTPPLSLSMTNFADHDSIAHERQPSPDIASDENLPPVKKRGRPKGSKPYNLAPT